MREEPLLFLSQEWLYEVTKAVQSARSRDEEFRRITSEFSLSLLYVITDPPPSLRGLYSNSGRIFFFIRLERGSVRKLWIGIEEPKERIDFTVSSSYRIAKQIFNNELSLASAFISHQFKVEPLHRVYTRPGFTAKAIVAGNWVFKFARQVPTTFPSEQEAHEVRVTPIDSV